MNRLLIAAFVAGALLHGAAQAAAPAWPQDRSEFKPDPALRFGSLPNGMRYVLRHNTTPTGQVSLRLRFDTGSIHELEDQRGLAHFLEHMAFRGSANIPDGEVMKTLERLGLRSGADTNAFTGQTQTVYQFDLARNDEDSLRTGLGLLREICDRLKLDAATFETERGVVMAEARLRDGAPLRASEALQSFMLQGQLAAERLPIGKLAVLQNAPINRLRQFYHDWYRPERATLLIVGDIDVDALEQRVSKEFGDWRNAAPAPAEPDLGQPAQRSFTASIFNDPGAQPAITLGWARTRSPTARTHAEATVELARQLGEGILSRRLQTAAAAAQREFTEGGAGFTRLAHSADLELLSVGYEPDKWQAALTAAEKLRRQLVEQGIQKSELDRELLTLRTALQASVSGAGTRRSPQIANELVGNLNDDEVSSSAAQDLTLLDEISGQLTVEAVNGAMRGAFVGSGPLLFVSSPKAVEGGEAALLAALRQADQAQLTEAAVNKTLDWPYTHFGVPGKLAAESYIADLEVTSLRFANGVKLNIKSTHFTADQILVNVHVGNGLLDLPRNRPSLGWAASAVTLGGLGKLSFDELQRALTGKVLGIAFGVSDSSYVLSGQTRPADFVTQLQLLAAYLTDAGWRAEGFEQLRSSFLPQLATLRSNPSLVLNTQLAGITHGGDQRWTFPTAAMVRAADVAQLKAWLQPAFAHGDIEITIVGDITVEAARAAVADTFGALRERRQSPKRAALGEVRFPAPTGSITRLSHAGAPDQGMALVAWPGTDALANYRLSSQRQLMLSILQDRLKDQLRERAGLSYSVSAQGQASVVFPGFGVLLALADLPPAKAALLFDTVTGIAADLRTRLPSADELERARNPALAGLKQARQSNQYWISVLGQVQREPRLAESVRQQIPNLQSVTGAEVQAAAAQFLVDAKELRIVVQAESAPGP